MAEVAVIEGEKADAGSPKRRQVLDAAEQLFLGQGYGDVSMDAVARTAGVSKATLYAHFESKDQLFASIVAERGLSHVLDEIGFPADDMAIDAALRSIGERTLVFMLSERKLRILRIAVAESVRFPELGRAFYENGPQRTQARFAEWLARRGAAGDVEVPDPDVAAQHFMAMLRGCLFLRATLGVLPAPDHAEIERTLHDAVAAWLRAYGRREPRPPHGDSKPPAMDGL